MKILHVVGRLTPEWGGLSLFVAQIAKYQSVQGHAITILTGKQKPDQVICDIGAASHTCVDEKVCVQFVQTFDVVHIHGLWLPLYWKLARLTRHAGVPLILSTHGMLEAPALKFSRWRKRLAWYLFQRKLLTGADLLHATTQAETRTLRHQGMTQPVIEIPPAVEIQRDVRARSNQTKKTALFLGRLHLIKGIDLLVDAWISVGDNNWQLIVAGPDESGLMEDLKKRIQKSAIDIDVNFIGPVYGDDKTQLLQDADLVIVPSLSENFGVTVIEGLGHGCPVMTTTGTPWQSLAERKLGWLSKPSAESISETLSHVLSLPLHELQEMGANGREWVQDNFSWHIGADRLVAAYSWLHGKCEKPSRVRLLNDSSGQMSVQTND